MKKSEKLDREYAKLVEGKPIKKRNIKDFYVCADAFGSLPVWSIQDYREGFKDAYMLPYGSNKEWMKFLQKLDKKIGDDFEILIEGTVYYANWQKDYDLVVHLHIDELRLFTREQLYFYMEEENKKFLKNLKSKRR